MTLTIDNKLPFWREDFIAKLPYTIVLLVNGDRRIFSNTLTNEVSETSVREQLKNARRGILSSFVNEKGELVFKLLTGNLKIHFFSWNKGNGRRLSPVGWMSFASNDDRARALKNGVILEFRGIDIVGGTEFKNLYENRDRIYKTGEYINSLESSLKTSFLESAEISSRTVGVIEKYKENNISDEQLRVIDILQGYINAEYQVDCLNEQHEPSFFYENKKASSIRHVMRQFYDLTLTQADYERILLKQPKLLALEEAKSAGSEISFEVVDFEPSAGKPIIQVSTQRQILAKDIPNSGLLKIVAHPILKQIRSAIVEKIRDQQTNNPWLLSLLANELVLSDFDSRPITINSGEFPPTPAQQKAIEAGIATPDYSLVLGPPGTGKTTVILEWVRYFVNQGKRVLVTSQNNKAVDNVLERLVQEAQFECLRIGNESKISSSLEHVMLDNKLRELQQRLFEGNKPLIKFFDSAIYYLDYLLANSEIIEEHFSQIFKATGQLEDIEHKLEVLSYKFTKAQKELGNTEHLIEKNNKRLVELETNPLRGLKKLFIGPFIIWRKRKLRTAIIKLQLNQQDYANQVSQHKVDIEDLSTARNHQKGIILGSEQALARFDESHPGNYEEYINIPIISTFKNKTTITLKEHIERLRNIVAGWYEKIAQEREQSLYPLLLEHINVVGATCIGINTRQMFRDIDFDVVIVDEAGQIQAHNLIVPLSRCSKAILVGDHKQIGPIASDEIIGEIKLSGIDYHELNLYRKSWFEILWNQSPKSRKFMLDTQFRCPSEISDFVSVAFYDGEYYAGSNKKNSKALLPMFKKPMIWLDTSMIKNNREQRSDNGFSGNMTETNIVVEVFRRAINARPQLLENREVAIIVPYRAHVQQIQKRIKKLQKENQLPEFSVPLHELVASVDSFQGQERDLVIFALSRSNQHGSVGFLKDWQRINVAVTRAKRQLVIIGNSRTVTYVNQKSKTDDFSFKQAMKLLVTQLEQSNAIIEGFRFFPKAKSKVEA